MRRKRNVVDAIGLPRDPELMVHLGAELEQIAADVQLQLGMDSSSRRRAALMAARRKKVQASDQVLERIYAMARLLETWQRGARYQATDGSPKVIPIKGKGASFQSLVKEFAPRMSIQEALKFLVSQSDVRLVSGNKVALLGSAAVIYPRTPEILLAGIVVHLRRFTHTIMNNAVIPPGISAGALFERQVTGRFTKKQWASFAQSIHSALDDLTVHVDRQSEDRPRKKDAKHACGLSVYLWED